MTLRVEFELYEGCVLRGAVVDRSAEAEYGTGPYDLLTVDVPGKGTYSVPEPEATRV